MGMWLQLKQQKKAAVFPLEDTYQTRGNCLKTEIEVFSKALQELSWRCAF